MGDPEKKTTSPDSVPQADRKPDADHSMANSKENLELARMAMNTIDPVGSKRSADIRERLERGYYSSPEIAREVALRVVVDMIATRKPGC